MEGTTRHFLCCLILAAKPATMTAEHQAIGIYRKTSREVVQRRVTMRKLKKALADFIVYKMLRAPPRRGAPTP